ncbi:hypothetical protein LTR44_006025 [Exophiala sp. CCFEE 6388]|nr:hypothetical protein LTR44_006025 [Eurotiomycetes sp. CCFEE 6388]
MSFLEVEGWDLQYVRTSETSFPASCTGLIAYLEAAARQCQGESQTPSPISARFNMSAEKLRQCLKWYENKIQAEAESMTSTEACVVPGLPPFDPALESFFEGFDDGLWADFTGDFGNTGMVIPSRGIHSMDISSAYEVHPRSRGESDIADHKYGWLSDLVGLEFQEALIHTDPERILVGRPIRHTAGAKTNPA